MEQFTFFRFNNVFIKKTYLKTNFKSAVDDGSLNEKKKKEMSMHN